jgi:hypothetical protein
MAILCYLRYLYEYAIGTLSKYCRLVFTVVDCLSLRAKRGSKDRKIIMKTVLAFRTKDAPLRPFDYIKWRDAFIDKFDRIPLSNQFNQRVRASVTFQATWA